MAKTRKPLPVVDYGRNKYGAGTLAVWIDNRAQYFDFDYLPELRPMLMRCYDWDVVKEILRQVCALAEGVAPR